MQCLHPLDVRNPKTGSYMLVPCGKCPACLHRRQNEWAYRLMLEDVYSPTPTYFGTLTYEDSNLEINDKGLPTLNPSTLSSFLKRTRQKLFRDYGCTVRWFACGEYGDTFLRPHYHFMLYDCTAPFNELQAIIEQMWPNGFVTLSYITPQRAKYVAKYTIKQLTDTFEDVVPPFATMTRRPAFGRAVFNDSKQIDKWRNLRSFTVYDIQGTPYNMPRYIRERVFSKKDLQIRQFAYEVGRDLSYNGFVSYQAKVDYEYSFLDNYERLFYYRESLKGIRKK